jgi:DNA anti-recombination protein RmuC
MGGTKERDPMKYYSIALVAAGTILWSGCDPTLDETRVEPTPSRSEPVETASEGVGVTNARGAAEIMQKESVLATVEQTMTEVDARMAQVSNTAEQAAADGQSELQSALTNLREQRSELNALLERMREASGNAWQEMQREFRVAYQEFLSALEETEGMLRG